jgi:fibronectin type 3 domain-containing protein
MRRLLILLLSVAAFGQVTARGHLGARAHVIPGPSHNWSIYLWWTPSTTPGVTYNVYRGTVSGGPYQKIVNTTNSGSYVDANVGHHFTFFYVVTSFDGTNESVFSNEVQVTQ